MRKTKSEISELCMKLDVDMMWSWSRYNTYKTDSYSYYLKYIKHIREDRNDSIYTYSGSFCHDILEKYYNNLIKQEDMINEYNDSLFTMNIAEYKYDRSDEEKNKTIANKYESCIKDFFIKHTKPNMNMILEMYIIIKISEGIIFNGYIDNCGVYTDENKEKRIVITDYKTSSIYKGEKLEKESGQLYLYAEGIRQKTKLPLDHISIGYLFLKYVTVECEQANGIWKERQIERNSVGEKLSSSAKMWLKKLGYEPNDFIEDMILNNSIDNLPKDVQSKFKISDCYVYLPLEESYINELKSDIINTVNEINEKESEYKKIQDENLFWSEITNKNEYYFNVLSGYSRKLHKPYDEFLKEKEMFIQQDKEQEEEDNELLEFLNNL